MALKNFVVRPVKASPAVFYLVKQKNAAGEIREG